ncbi:MAG: HsdR family type I site-specific deoxyribonuclease [Veillonella dispar]|uniref:type I restriction endonuclease subunit R n=1 Tax=Veillonella dispar TaxID=39778 RepID=UPI00290468D0|nr:HsdR family type I site-specific deoxyribonuclease [Veillonella dispar]MDU1986857.1 HsdR family type I site-specific deoxyribonuclease [Veillonella dispar]
MTELEFENKLIEQLSTGIVTNTDNINQIGDSTDAYGNMKVYKSKLWKYEPTIKTTEALWENFRKILYQLNQNQLTQPLSDTEFKQVQKVINELYTPYQAGQFLYGINGVSQVEVDLDDGRHVFLTVFDQKQIGAGNTVYQVVSQVKREPQSAGRPERRFDTTLLINGLPIIQIEEKSVKHSVDEALNQMHQYIQEKQYSDIFSTVQILVAMTPNRIKYMANTTADLFNKDFAFEWQNPNDNKVVRNWTTFADMFLSIPMAHQMSTLFTILDGTKNKQMLKVMRPYQVYATKAVLNELKHADFDLPINKLGYVWHTTGSGKTITSFKTAWLASRMPNVDKVVFVVDRIALTKQTEANYKAYDPEGSIDIDGKQIDTVGGTENTSALKKKLNEKGYGIIVTSVQKLNTLINRRDFVLPEKNFVFIVDEAHRSTGGESFEELQKVFKGAAWVGYTGTPMFDKVVGKKGTKTHEVFGKLLHAYTIREAIADKNVLGFKVDFETTIAEDKMKLEYLPKFYKEKYPNWNEVDIERKIANLTDDDMDDMIEASFYDNNLDHVKLVVEDIFKNWRNRSNDGAYNAMLTTHVGGNRASTPMALMYFDEFERVNQERLKQGLPTLKVGITFSMSTNNSDNQLTTNNGLLRAMKHYNKMFRRSFGLDDVSGYTQELITRLNRTVEDGQYLDLVIVVDQLLTGFDAPQLNTLYVDRTLKDAMLIQAYSRTNRIADNQGKPWGRIVNYRWPAKNEELMNRALSIYANKHSADVQDTLVDAKALVDTGVLAKPFKEQFEEVKHVVDRLADMTDNFTEVPASDAKQEEMFNLMRTYSAGMSKLKQYDPDVINGEDIGFDYDNPDELVTLLGMTPEQEEMLTTSLYNDLKERIAKNHNVPVTQIELRMIHVKQISVNYDYLTELIEALMNAVHESRMDAAADYLEKINDFAMALDDRQYAKQINNAVDAIYKGTYPPEGKELQYPVKLTSLEVIEDVNTMIMKDDIFDFRLKWGIIDVISNDEILDLFSRHTAGKQDLDSTGRISKLKKDARAEYQAKAQDTDIVSLNKIKYGNELVAALYKFADSYINER